MHFDEIDVSEVWYSLFPFLSISFRDEVDDIVAFWALSVFLLEPKQFLNL